MGGIASKKHELHRKREKLEETNVALKVLLKHRDRDLVDLIGHYLFFVDNVALTFDNF